MLTRLEIDRFKNLLDFHIDFGPFTCLAGPNAVGKSNVFDAIRFLSLLADHPIVDAALLVRGSDTETSGVLDLFWTDGVNRADSFRIAAEMVIEPVVRDDFGRPTETTSTYLKYEIEIGYEAPSHRGTLGRLVLQQETLDYITEGQAASKLHFPHSSSRFRDAVITNRRRSQSGYISTNRAADGQIEIVVHQDVGSRGPGQTAPAITAPRTIVATSNTSATPTILAVRREMQSWRLLGLEPSAMRRPDRFNTEQHITSSGGRLAATLHRLMTDADDEEAVCASIVNRLTELVPVSSLRVHVDDVRQLLTLYVEELSGVELPAGSLSDGTLRFLTLAILAADPTARGLLCIEEPENGIHPAKMHAMVELLHDLAVDPDDAPDDDNPFRQVILATHSPSFVQLQNRPDVLFAIEAKVRSPKGGPTGTLRCRPLDNTWRVSIEHTSVGLATILVYLSSPPGAQIQLPVIERQAV